MSGDHLERFFAAIDDGIEKAELFHSNDLKTRKRDKAMLFACYQLGLRSAECCGLTTRSYEPRADRPELGDFGFFHIFGKGDKYRTVHSLDPLLTEVLNWYMAEVRPLFMSIKTANVTALFLSERGLPISDDQLGGGYKRILEEAGLTEFGYTLHCLRHTYVTDAEQLIGLGAVKDQVGHAFMATTEGYYRKDPMSIAASINAGIDKTINLRKPKE
jgi:site-specific recombinase XerD